ncbi:hypothetical protein Tco_0145524 [Tanacetum coccineum]
MDTLEQQLTKETILVSNFQNAFRVLKTQFEKIFSSVLIKPSSLDDYMLKTIIHAQTIQKRLDDKKLQIQECTFKKFKALEAIFQKTKQKSCMVSFRNFHSHLQHHSHDNLKGTMFLNMDQLEKQLDKEEFQEIGSAASFKGNRLYNRTVEPSLLDNRLRLKSERPSHSISQRFASQVDVNNDLSKPVTTHYLPKEKESAVAKPHHMIAPGSSRRKPTGKIFKTVGLRWVPTGKIFTSSTTKVDSEPQNGSNEDIANQYECEQTLDVSAGTLNLSAGTSFTPKKEGLRVLVLLKKTKSEKQGFKEFFI